MKQPGTSEAEPNETQSALLHAVEEWRTTFDAIGDLVCVLDMEGRIRRCNSAMADHLRKPFDQIIGQKLKTFVVHSAGTLPEYPFLRTLETGRAEKAILSLGGRWYRALANPVLARDGEMVGCVCTFADFTGHRKTEEALRTNLLFQSVLETAPSLIIVTDMEGRILQFNRACIEVTGYELHEAAGKHVSDFLLPEGSWEKLRSASLSSDAEEGAASQDMPLRTKSGKERVITWRVGLLFRHADKPFIICAGTDVTVGRRAEYQLGQAEKLSALGELIAGIAHELNNPLAGVVGFSQLLVGRPDCPPDIARDLRRIEQNARRCKSIVEGLLRFARQHKPEREVVSIHKILDETADLLAYQFRAANIEVIRDYGEAVPPVNVDFNQFQQVFVNIMTNAAQAMRKSHEGGHLTIRTVSDGSAVRVELADDGPGIAPERLSKIFDPFFTTKPQGEGTGLGLSVCFGIVTAHRGRIWAESKVEEGATFAIQIPAAKQEDVRAEPRVTDTQIMRRKHRVLIVDDEEVVRDILERILAALGFRVTTASTGEEALAVIDENPIDIIICDLRMPGLGGQGVHEAVVSRDPELAKRMIFCTGDTVSRDSREFLQLTGCRVVSKPFDLDRIKHAIAEVQHEMIRGRATAAEACEVAGAGDNSP